jgi:hypothetical protein
LDGDARAQVRAAHEVFESEAIAGLAATRELVRNYR